MTGQYCPACGQKRIHPQDLSARRFVHELADELGKLNFKFKTLRTLRALLAPGLLTTEYLAGRREPYLSPIKIYFVCAAIFFFAAPWVGFDLASLISQDESGSLARVAASRMAERGLDQALFSARFDIRLQSIYTLALGFSVVFFALTLQGLFHRQQLPYGAHLVFSLHYLSFQYLLTVPTGAARLYAGSEEVVAAVALFLLTFYVYWALKRVYGETTRVTVLKAATLFLLTVAMNYVVSFAAIRTTLALA
jgi:hypothetical protein